jgi:transketolase
LIKNTNKDLELKSIEYRKKVLKYIKLANAGHTGGSLSCVDILNVLYNRVLNVSPDNFSDPDRDRYIHSKGHSVEALYVVLADFGFFPEKDLETLCQYRSNYVGHPTRKVLGIEMNTGALGHGLPISVGIALGGKKVFTLLGDGELPEGSNWEAMLAAAHYRLDYLTVIIDYNRLQITGPSQEVCGTEPLKEKFEAFGWQVRSMDGHSIEEITETFEALPFRSGAPNMIIANTTKGKGISFIEDNYKWHHKVPSNEEYERAIKELNLQREELLAVA